MEHLLYDLINHIGSNMPDIRTVDEDYGQLEMLDDSRESYPLVFPAVLIDSPETSWDNIAGLDQKGLCSVTVRLCLDCYDDTHYKSGQTDRILERDLVRKELHNLLQGHRIDGSSALIRTSSRFWTAGHGIKVYESTYTLEVSESVDRVTQRPAVKPKISVSAGTFK